ncbi:hypothetical protein B0H16DRAFT_1717771 [Mycena metata]|uniref:Uncharacterized protein n=1 Tax=Mycena metata TaxID=1033252 RepID=A0AAD7NLB1_9AGAR|nr:hypothetical protein B0H16DRAFT_1717771 [Mycena metata]
MALLPSPSGSLRDSGHLRSPVASPEPSVMSPEFSLGHTNNRSTTPGCLLLLGYASAPVQAIRVSSPSLSYYCLDLGIGHIPISQPEASQSVTLAELWCSEKG